ANLIAVLTPASGSEVHGTVTFTAVEDDMVRVEAHVTGLEPDSKHAIHIHEFGDVRAEDGTSAGGHYNPEDHPHGLPDEDTRHAGDFGNLHADEDGVARFTLGVDNVTLFGKENPIIGRSVIVHAKKDDGGQPTGNAGARLAAGVIGVQNVSWQD
ncbi:MAG: superoxide dismutase family protein, partial [Verrucomicrobiota bacterium]